MQEQPYLPEPDPDCPNHDPVAEEMAELYVAWGECKPENYLKARILLVEAKIEPWELRDKALEFERRDNS